MTSTPRAFTLPDLALTHGGVDRGGEDRRKQGWLEEALTNPATRVLAVAQGTTPLAGGRLAAPSAPEAAELLNAATVIVWLGRLDGVDWVAAALPQPPASWGGAAVGLRDAAGVLDRAEAALFTQALAVLNWHAVSGFCSRCGAPTEPVDAGWVRRCTAEGTEHFPRTDAAVIVLVTDEADRVLLGANAAWGGSRYSLFAGFVEPGESLEEAAAREVGEEAGIGLEAPVYAGSQPWPLPASLMLGFTARAIGTASVPDGEEILSTRWFTREQLASEVSAGAIGIPSGPSIAGALLEAWFGAPLPAPPEGAAGAPAVPAAVVQAENLTAAPHDVAVAAGNDAAETDAGSQDEGRA